MGGIECPECGGSGRVGIIWKNVCFLCTGQGFIDNNQYLEEEKQ